MPNGDEDDELVLGAMECYERAVHRVAQDFARRGAVIQPVGVHLDTLDALPVCFGRRGQARAGVLGSLRPTGAGGRGGGRRAAGEGVR
ncbi:hypothetical protein KIF24_20235 [Micromonospora sp. Llam7]|uniref:hypothetical protein n=1 Tax=Micromonospora tarapacensis TaxID=2835305 RepID=UPI001C828F35|nr:hypothetical protein [Micromonospora tarapacensis]MBX7268135.1 hypothetical protein [Micromonospora tarapacensis]